MKLFCIYLLLVNLLALLVMGADKRRARAHRWRFPERTLFLLALAGGSLGGMLGMYLFRHKTRHLRFAVGMPLILLLQCALLYFLR